MRKETERNIMRARARDYDGASIEFGDEPEKFFSRVVREFLPWAIECGMGRGNDKKTIDLPSKNIG